MIISAAFYLGVTEVTRQTWLQVTENRPGPAAFWQRKAGTQYSVVGLRLVAAPKQQGGG